MISQKWTKLIKSLHMKKFRKEHQQFLVEGEKAVLELIQSGWPISALFGTPEFFEQHPQAELAGDYCQPCSAHELTQVGTLSSNQAALAVVQVPQYPAFKSVRGKWVLVLDNINDPGNLGSIIRIADWYGISNILCSSDTVDVFNPKVIAAAKGSFLRVQLHYGDLSQWLAAGNAPIYGTYLAGESVHSAQFPADGGFLVLGNEANGISEAITGFISQRITIPCFGHAESLNVGIAAAIVLDNIQRSSKAQPQ